jgi:hypothetical protein
VTAVVIPIVGFILGIVAVTRRDKWASKHGVWIIVVSIVFFAIGVAAIASSINSSVNKATTQLNQEIKTSEAKATQEGNQAAEKLKQEDAVAEARAKDASAKELARTAQTTAETIAVDNSGSYESVTPATLQEVEESIPLEEISGSAYLSAAKGDSNSYTVTTTAGESSGHRFTIKSTGGVVTRTCEPEGAGGCPAGGRW